MLLLVASPPDLFWQASAQSSQAERQLKREPAQLKSSDDRRLALVVGNGNYLHASRLSNPPNDAEDMAIALRDLGFELVGGRAHVNQTAEQIKQLVTEFGERLSTRGGVGLFYYAGHGVQSQGRNYLIPIEARVLREKTLEFDAVDVNRVLAEMDAAGNGFNILILDACRNNPFASAWRDAGQGLAQVNAPEGTLIAYSTSPGRIANDGEGRNGTYTGELLRQMRLKGLTIEEVFKAVRSGVRLATKNQQTPWEASSLIGDFCFAGKCKEPLDVPDPDVEFWNSIKNSTDVDDYRAYKNTFPSGRYVATADNYIRRMSPTQTGPVLTAPAKTETSVANTEDRKKTQAVVVSADRERGIDLYKTNQIPDAIRALQGAVKKNASDYLAWNFLGLALIRKGDLKEATKSFETAIKLNGSFATFHTNLSLVLRLRNKTAEAEREARLALSIDPNNAEAHYILGEIRFGAGRNEEALELATNAIKLNPQLAPAYRLKAQALVNFIGDAIVVPTNASDGGNSRYAEAAAALENYLRLSPKSEETQVWADLLDNLRSRRLPSFGEGGEVFNGKDVTTKARVISKPEPGYTEAARANKITGHIILRGVFAADGTVRYLRVLSGLPLGLTEQALKAARQIKFIPATRDGRPVSMFVQLEYNFYQN